MADLAFDKTQSTRISRISRIFLNPSSVSRIVIGCALRVHGQLGPGYLENVYQKSLALELNRQKISFQQLAPIAVHYNGHRVGYFIADFIVEQRLILELKAHATLTQADEAQVVNYLKATSMKVGLLLNFGAPSLQIRRKVHNYSQDRPV